LNKFKITALFLLILYMLNINILASLIAEDKEHIIKQLNEISKLEKAIKNDNILSFIDKKIPNKASLLLSKINKIKKSKFVLVRYKMKITRDLVYLNKRHYCLKNKRANCEKDYKRESSKNVITTDDLFSKKELINLKNKKKYDETEYYLHPRKSKNIIYNKMVFSKDKHKYVKSWGEREKVRLSRPSYIYEYDKE